MPENFYLFFLTALIPLAVGAIYYNPKLLGAAWMRANKFGPEGPQGGNMAVIFGMTYLFGLFLSFMLPSFVIHQGGVAASAMTGPGEWTPEATAAVNAFLADYGDTYRDFGHGAVHGFILSLLGALPIIAINALFERRGWAYIFIHWGYWAVTLTFMGGVLCRFLVYSAVL